MEHANGLIRKTVIKWLKSISNLSIFYKNFYGNTAIVIIVISITISVAYAYTNNVYINEAGNSADRLVSNLNDGFKDINNQVDRIIMSIYADTPDSGSNTSMEDVIFTKGYSSDNEKYMALKLTRDFFQRLIFLREDFNSIYIYVSPEQSFSYCVNGRNILDYDPTKQSWYRETMLAGGNIVISPPHFPYQLNYDKKVISFSRYLRSTTGEKFATGAVVLIDLSIDSINSIINKVNLDKTTGVIFLDNNGKVIFNYNTQYNGADIGIDNVNRILNSTNGRFTANIANIKFLINYNSSETTGWKLLTLTPYSQVAQDYKKLALFLILLLVFSIATVGIVSYLFSRIVFRPIKSLQEGMAEVKIGNFDIQLVQQSNDEIGQLVADFNSMLSTINILILDKYKEKLARNSAEFKYLQAQINPHFVYNTLQTISSIAIVKRVTEIDSIAVKLAKMLRYSVNNKSKTITIREEMENLRCYMDIQKIRFKGNISYIVDIDEEVYSYSIIKLVLQPIAENAFIHGIEPKGEPGLIKLSARHSDGTIRFEIYDNGVGISTENVKALLESINSDEDDEVIFAANDNKSSIGLRNINVRLKMTYGKEYGLRIESQLGEWTKVLFLIPTDQMKGGI